MVGGAFLDVGPRHAAKEPGARAEQSSCGDGKKYAWLRRFAVCVRYRMLPACGRASAIFHGNPALTHADEDAAADLSSVQRAELHTLPLVASATERQCQPCITMPPWRRCCRAVSDATLIAAAMAGREVDCKTPTIAPDYDR
jgi:hypothetical protein